MTVLLDPFRTRLEKVEALLTQALGDGCISEVRQALDEVRSMLEETT